MEQFPSLVLSVRHILWNNLNSYPLVALFPEGCLQTRYRQKCVDSSHVEQPTVKPIECHHLRPTNFHRHRIRTQNLHAENSLRCFFQLSQTRKQQLCSYSHLENSENLHLRTIRRRWQQPMSCLVGRFDDSLITQLDNTRDIWREKNKCNVCKSDI